MYSDFRATAMAVLYFDNEKYVKFQIIIGTFIAFEFVELSILWDNSSSSMFLTKNILSSYISHAPGPI